MTDLKIERLRSQGVRRDLLARDAGLDDGGEWRSPAVVFGSQRKVVDFGAVGLAGGASVTVAVTDGLVVSDSVVVVTVSLTAGRDSDELELDPIDVAVGKITAGVGYDVVVSPPAGSNPHGTYLVNTVRM